MTRRVVKRRHRMSRRPVAPDPLAPIKVIGAFGIAIILLVLMSLEVIP